MRKRLARFIENIWAADLAKIGSLSSFNQVLNVYYVKLMFSYKILGLKLSKIKKR